MKVDSGFMCSIVNLKAMYNLGISKKALRPCTRKVLSYTQQPVEIMGNVDVTVAYDGRKVQLPLLVKKGSGIGILGRDWFLPLGISLNGQHQLGGGRRPAVNHQYESVLSVTTLLDGFSTVFDPALGMSKRPPLEIEVKDKASLKLHKICQVRIALLSKLEAREKLVEQGVYLPVIHSRWATLSSDSEEE